MWLQWFRDNFFVRIGWSWSTFHWAIWWVTVTYHPNFTGRQDHWRRGSMVVQNFSQVWIQVVILHQKLNFHFVKLGGSNFLLTFSIFRCQLTTSRFLYSMKAVCCFVLRHYHPLSATANYCLQKILTHYWHNKTGFE